MSLQDMVASSISLKLRDAKGKEFDLRMSPLTDRDQAELDEYVQSRLIDNARRSLPDDADDKLFKRVMTLAMRESLGLSYGWPPGSLVFRTPSGLARLVYQCVKRESKDVTLDQLIGLMRVDQNVIEFNLAFARANPPLPDVAAAGGGGDSSPQ